MRSRGLAVPQRAKAKRADAKRDARATASPLFIPGEAVLRDEFDQLAGYRLLVTYLERFTLEAAIKFRHLAAIDQEGIRDFNRHRTPAALPRRWEPDLDRPVRWQDATGRTLVVYPYGKQARLRRGPRAFTLALAWVLMERDIRQAALDPSVVSETRRIAGPWDCSQVVLLQLSYVPREVARLLIIRRGASVERRLEGNAIRRLRQLEARDRPIPPDLAGLSPTDRRQARLWWEGLGIDKESGTLSRQRFWSMIIVPLLDALGAKSGRISIRRVALDVSWLLRVRYPDLKTPDPELIRKRYYRAP